MHETHQEILAEWQTGTILKCVTGGRIVGSVRAHLAPGRVCRIGKLVVDPACQRMGIGEKLMREIEALHVGQCEAYTLFTAADTHHTSALYRRLGYREVSRRTHGEIEMIYMEKPGGKPGKRHA